MRVIAIDFDNTLYDYNKRVINKEKVNRLYETPDNFIVIYTARSYSQFDFIRENLEKLIDFKIIDQNEFNGAI